MSNLSLWWGLLVLPFILAFAVGGLAVLRFNHFHSKRMERTRQRINNKMPGTRKVGAPTSPPANGEGSKKALRYWLYGVGVSVGIPVIIYFGLEFKGWLENPPFTPREMAEFMWVAGAVLLIAFCTLYIVATMTPWKERIRAALWMLPIMFGVAVFFALVEWLREPSDERVVITQRLTTEEQPFSFNDRGLTVVVGQTDDFICLFPLPDAGNYTFRLGDGSAWAQGARARTATMFLQAPPGETRSVVGFLHPTEACSRT